jgi:hypothetical protein
MRTTPSPASTAGRAASLAVLAAGLIAGCYSPKLTGAFKCNLDYEPAFQCPDGYHCVSGFCTNGSTPIPINNSDAGDASHDMVPDRMEVHPETPSIDATTADVPPDLGCTPPAPICTPDMTKMCDPLCQSGCGCKQKCSAITDGAMAGTLTCNMPLATRPRVAGEQCDQASAGSAAQTDNCGPGLVCLQDSCNFRCYRFCKTDADCPMSTCTKPVGNGPKVCDVPNTACDPVGPSGGVTGCPTMTQACYLSKSVKDRTYCDCPSPAGAGGPNSSCTTETDCFGGLACVMVGGSSLCRPVCSLAAGANDCVATTCTPINKSTKFGFCN